MLIEGLPFHYIGAQKLKESKKNLLGHQARPGVDKGTRTKIEIPVQVPAIETCFMSIDEIARIFSKSQGPYRGGEFGI